MNKKPVIQIGNEDVKPPFSVVTSQNAMEPDIAIVTSDGLLIGELWFDCVRKGSPVRHQQQELWSLGEKITRILNNHWNEE